MIIEMLEIFFQTSWLYVPTADFAWRCSRKRRVAPCLAPPTPVRGRVQVPPVHHEQEEEKEEEEKEPPNEVHTGAAFLMWRKGWGVRALCPNGHVCSL